MPTSRNRRRASKSREASHRGRSFPSNSAELGELRPWLELMFRANEAEARGDAAGALDLLTSRPDGPDGEPFYEARNEFGGRQARASFG